ncbi:KTSC domain-containing protein [Rhizobium leguminosarum]|uniref:KTSC domain-containing protein n=1 Tax=Rhizobium leguminosarum TaxID=384 RepID=A0A4V2IIS9_RHILE|nr:KTSC domain-containing protein [Rhizobium leguminosarum]TAX59329.1 KTSC domain-containing protein [Rhizobium leguminosarum]TAX70876.1 KTSC domain-containing protein [Rhizobium leguminosarum]
MQRQAVSSSTIASIGYDPNEQVIEVEFNDGAVYQYMNVPEIIFDGMMAAGSHGSYLNAHIKGQYSYQRL